MSRLGMLARQRAPRAQFLSEWGEAIVSGLFLLLFMAGLAVLAVEFPNGFADLRQFDIKLVSQGK